MDRVTSMRVFVRAASAGSLSAAARHLGMSPAMATKHVNALEARLGVKLFHRTTRRLSLTEAGSNYLDACQRILPEIDEAEAPAASQRVKASGLLRMNVPLSFGTCFIAPLLHGFSQQHPEVRVELGLSDALLDLIDGNWDLAIRIGRLADSPLQTRQLGRASCRETEVSLRLEAFFLFAAAGGLFNVDGDRQPDARLHIHAPTVEVEVVAGIVFRARSGVGSVEADDVAVLVFDPHTAIKAAHAGNLGMDVKDPGANRTQEFAAH